MIETSRLELKRAFTEEIKKERVAFANTDGGKLVIGLADDGTVVGVENPDQVSSQVTNIYNRVGSHPMIPQHSIPSTDQD